MDDAADTADGRTRVQEAPGGERMLRYFVAQAPAALAMLDTDLRYIAASERWRQDYGLGDRPLVGVHHYDVFPEVPAHWKAVHQRCLGGRTERMDEELFTRADGSHQWLRWEVRPWRSDAGSIGGLIIYSEDITARKAIESALHDSQRRQEEAATAMRQLVETAAQGIVSVDANGAITMANVALGRMFAHEPADLVGQPIETLLPQAMRDGHARHRQEYFGAPRPRPMGVGLDLEGRRRDGSTFPVEVSLTHIATSAGGMAFAFVTDITARKRTESALRERTAELEGQTHRLREIAADLTVAEQHAREELSKTLHDGLQQILFSSRLKLARLKKRLVDLQSPDEDLLDRACRDLDEAIAAARSLAIELFPPGLHNDGLAAGLEWLSASMRDKYGLRVDLTADPAANPDRRDVRTLIFESVRELLFNVVKHAGVDRVTVSLSRTADGAIQIVVADRGRGFDAASVLAPTQTHRLGLGLYSVRERLALLGGRLDIDSAPGQGTTFTIVAPPGSQARPLGAGGRNLRGTTSRGTESRVLTILIADDHALVRDGLRELFADRPELQVVGEAANGHEALAQAHALRPDVIVMDVSMPHMDGVEATRRIRAELPFIRVYGLSTEERTDRLHAIEDAGAVGYFTKGDDSQRLLDRLLDLHARGTWRPRGD